MVKKGRKLIALLLMVALVVTYTFGASFSAFADDGQGEAVAKASASEDATPDKPDPQPQPEPDTPAPTEPSTPDTPDDPDNPGEPGDGTENGDVTGQDGSDVGDVEGEEANEAEEESALLVLEDAEENLELEGTPMTVQYGETRNVPHPNPVGVWNVVPNDYAGLYEFNNGTIKNKNDSGNNVTITVRYSYRSGLWSRIDSTEITLKKANEVTFMFKGIDDSDFSPVKTVKVGTSVPSGDIPSYDSPVTQDETTYKFYGWYKDSSFTEKASFSDINGDMTVYGAYKGTAKIIFKKNTDEAADIPDPIEEAEGVSVNLGHGDCPGYKFTGWKDADGNDYAADADIDMPAGGLTLYAQWEEDADQVSINYYYGPAPNIGFIGSDSVRKTEQTNLRSDPPSLPGLVFVGWTQTYPVGYSGTFYPGQSITPADHVGNHHNINLTAVWANIAENVTGPLHANGKTITYDGEEHTIEGIQEGTDTTVRAGRTLKEISSEYIIGASITYFVDITDITASGTDVGQYATPVTSEVVVRVIPLFGPTTWVWSDEYVKVVNNLLIIKPCVVTISTDSDEKVYDGDPLTAGGSVTYITVNEDGEEVVNDAGTFTPEGGTVQLVGGKTLNIKATGEQTEVGSSENGYKVDWGKPDDWGTEASTAVKKNFTIETGSLGTLTVTEKPKPEPTPTPTPTPGPDGGGGGGAAVADNVLLAGAGDGVEVADDAAPTTIGEGDAPKSAPENSWALLDLIAAILTLLGAGFAAFRKNSATSVVKGVGLAAAAASIILFFVTQDLGAPMVLADAWTVVMAALFCVQGVTTAITMKTPQVDD